MARRDVPLDGPVISAVLQASLELRCIESELLGRSLEIVKPEIDPVGEQRLAILPKLALLAGASRRTRGQHRMDVEPQRKVHVHQPHLIAVLLAYRFERILGASAEGALKIAELDNGHARVPGAARRIIGGDLEAGRGSLSCRGESHCHCYRRRNQDQAEVIVYARCRTRDVRGVWALLGQSSPKNSDLT